MRSDDFRGESDCILVHPCPADVEQLLGVAVRGERENGRHGLPLELHHAASIARDLLEWASLKAVEPASVLENSHARRSIRVAILAVPEAAALRPLRLESRGRPCSYAYATTSHCGILSTSPLSGSFASSKHTRTRCPTATSPGARFTTLPITRTPGTSSIETSTTT